MATLTVTPLSQTIGNSVSVSIVGLAPNTNYVTYDQNTVSGVIGIGKVTRPSSATGTIDFVLPVTSAMVSNNAATSNRVHCQLATSPFNEVAASDFDALPAVVTTMFQASISPTSVQAGSSFTLDCNGGKAGDIIHSDLVGLNKTTELGTLSDAIVLGLNGTSSTVLTIPSTIPAGNYYVTAHDTTLAVILYVPITITSPAPPPLKTGILTLAATVG